MFAILVKLTVEPEHRDTLINTLVEDGQNSLKDEPGTLRFDLIQDNSNPNILFLYEAYRDEAAFQTHTQQPPFKKFMAIFQELLAINACKMEEISRGTPLFPDSESTAWQK